MPGRGTAPSAAKPTPVVTAGEGQLDHRTPQTGDIGATRTDFRLQRNTHATCRKSSRPHAYWRGAF